MEYDGVKVCIEAQYNWYQREMESVGASCPQHSRFDVIPVVSHVQSGVKHGADYEMGRIHASKYAGKQILQPDPIFPGRN
jgi:hypothetical protein